MLRNRKSFGVRFQFWLALIILVLNAHDSSAWGPQGHRVIGFIAEDHLQPEVKKIILQKFNIKSLAGVATWADVVRKKKKEQNPWHYTNIVEGELTYKVSRDCPSLQCVTEKIKEFSEILEDRSSSLKQKKAALKYLVHFVGDVHQPLHLGNKKDRGGGTLRFPYKGKIVSLHYLWDGGLIDWRKPLANYAENLNGKILATEISTWSQSTVNDWANESRSLALNAAYKVEKDGITKSYINRGREIINLRLAQAGVRLANLLNKILTNN